MNENDNLNSYQKLSEQRKKVNIENSIRYNKEKCTRITIKSDKEKFKDIENYMNKCIDAGACKSKNDFILSAVRYAIEKDFKNID